HWGEFCVRRILCDQTHRQAWRQLQVLDDVPRLPGLSVIAGAKEKFTAPAFDLKISRRVLTAWIVGPVAALAGCTPLRVPIGRAVISLTPSRAFPAEQVLLVNPDEQPGSQEAVSFWPAR